MVLRHSSFDNVLDQGHSAIRKALKPQNARESDARGDALVELEADDIGTVHRGHIFGKHAFDVLTRSTLIAEEMQRRARHTIADQAIGRLLRLRGAVEFSSQIKCRAELAVVHSAGPETPKRAELVVGVT